MTLKSFFTLLVVVLLLIGCSGQAPNVSAPPPTLNAEATLPPIAPGVAGPVEICDVQPHHPDCAGLQTNKGQIPEGWATYTNPQKRFALSYPADWQTMSVTPDPADGVRVMDAPSVQEATAWISLQFFQNPDRASLPVWIAENGPLWIGEVTETQEIHLNGSPVLQQTIVNQDPASGGPYTYTVFYAEDDTFIRCWTVWPGEDNGTMDLAYQIMATYRLP